MRERDRFYGGDTAYLRKVQYRDSSRLAARASLHVKYGTAPVGFFPWWCRQVDWRRGARVLDVGCGPGWLWAEATAYLPRNLDLTLLDLSEGMIREASTRLHGRGHHRRAGGLVGDAHALPLVSGSFDVVAANYVLHHMAEPAVAVAELARALRPTGVMVVAANGATHLQELRELAVEAFGIGIEPPRPRLGLDAAGAALRACFADVAWRPYDDRLVCRDPDDVLAYLVSVPPAEDADLDQRQKLLELVWSRFADGGGVLEVTKETGVFVCRHPRAAGATWPQRRGDVEAT
jgi:SAM-dependent methyltransferase